MKSVVCLVLIVGLISFSHPSASGQQASFRNFKEIDLGNAFCRTKGDTLIVNSGQLERIYELTPGGLRTISLDGEMADGEAGPGAARMADWDLGLNGRLVLNNISAKIDDDDGFTAKHIAVVTDFSCPGSTIGLRYIIWVYPGSGIRTQIELKNLPGDVGSRDTLKGSQSEYVPMALTHAGIKAFGYYNNTERRNLRRTPILKEEDVLAGTEVDWANGLVVSKGRGGIIVVKESHKCVNQAGVATGGFKVDPDGIAVTGLGLDRGDLVSDRYVQCWATWIVAYKGDSTDGMLALKEFDRLRYPVRKKDIYIMANTWGSGYSRYASRQEDVMKEIDVQAELGIDVQQIDDGWETRDWRPLDRASFYAFDDSLHPVKYEVYPDGWEKIKKYAQQKGVKLGLWALWDTPLKDLQWNYDHGGFAYYKLDGANLNTKKKLDDLDRKAREFVKYTGNSVGINWDVTENSPRFGYFYAREFGNIFLENREPVSGSYAFITYTPYLVLRDAWQIAKYVNLNKFQIPVQNIDKVNNLESDAYLYSNLYAVAITLMGSPVFFEETHFYSHEARKAIKNVLSVFKENRLEMSKGYVFPVGETPDNASWTGFQDVISKKDGGYLLVFREAHSESSSGRIALKFLRDQPIILTDLLTGEKSRVMVDKDGFVSFSIAYPAGFKFYRYETTVQGGQ